MGHKDVSTTMIYTHVLNKGGMGVKSPLDMVSWTDLRPVMGNGDVGHVDAESSEARTGRP